MTALDERATIIETDGKIRSFYVVDHNIVTSFAAYGDSLAYTQGDRSSQVLRGLRKGDLLDLAKENFFDLTDDKAKTRLKTHFIEIDDTLPLQAEAFSEQLRKLKGHGK